MTISFGDSIGVLGPEVADSSSGLKLDLWMSQRKNVKVGITRTEHEIQCWQ